VTEHQTNLKQLSKTPPELWLEHFVMANSKLDTIELTGTQIFKYFTNWKLDNGFEEYQMNVNSLGIKISNMRIDGIGKPEKRRDGNYRTFNIKKLKNHFNILPDDAILSNLKK
jgi:hypothetical protein